MDFILGFTLHWLPQILDPIGMIFNNFSHLTLTRPIDMLDINFSLFLLTATEEYTFLAWIRLWDTAKPVVPSTQIRLWQIFSFTYTQSPQWPFITVKRKALYRPVSSPIYLTSYNFSCSIQPKSSLFLVYHPNVHVLHTSIVVMIL